MVLIKRTLYCSAMSKSRVAHDRGGCIQNVFGYFYTFAWDTNDLCLRFVQSIRNCGGNFLTVLK
jgi:hypothetical protein